MKCFFVIILPLLLSIDQGFADKILSLDLKPMDSPFITMLKQDIHPRVIEAMVRAEIENGTIPVPLLRFMDNDFYGEVLFGHPGQKIRMSFDTSWYDTWIPSITCSLTSIPCALRNKYDPDKSPFSVRTDIPYKVAIGSSFLEGRVFYDLVHVNQVKVTKQPFAAVYQIPFIFVYDSYDGIMGMNLGKTPPLTPIIWNLQKQGNITTKVFSFYFNRNQQSKKGGTLVFGGVEKRHFRGNFTYAKLILDSPYPEWKFRVDGITASLPNRRKITVCNSGCNAIAATGGNPISGPTTEIDDLNIAIHAKHFILGRYAVNCTTTHNLPAITFSISGRNFTLKGANYVQVIELAEYGTICLSSFKPNDDPSDQNWYIGGAFMSKYYTTFDMDNKRIGFADANI